MNQIPLSFAPVFQERVWGGRWLDTLPGRTLPPNVPIGESWELAARSDVDSVVLGGPHVGLTLGQLWREFRFEVFGAAPDTTPFPLLVKLLDASETLSVQVHPPASRASDLGGEPKTEMWYFMECQPDAAIYAGLAPGITRESFERALGDGSLERCLHRIPVREGDVMFVPSGRIHAIGAGCRLLEVQQSSDTTYRVFDWNRMGLDGKPRSLHIAESLQCTDFTDIAPTLAEPRGEMRVECPFFRIEEWNLAGPRSALIGAPWAIFNVVRGAARCGPRVFERGSTFLVPANQPESTLAPEADGTIVVRATIPA